MRMSTVPWPPFFQSRKRWLEPGNWKAPRQSLRRVGVDDAVLERGERDQRLDRRARRVLAAQRAVEQRDVDVLRQCCVLGVSEPAREPVRVEASAC